MAPHAPLRRRGGTGAPTPRPVPAKKWHPGPPRHTEGYQTKQEAAYPGALNKRIVDLLVQAVGPRPSESTRSFAPSVASALASANSGCGTVSLGEEELWEIGPIKPHSLRGAGREVSGKYKRREDNELAIGGMRNLERALRRGHAKTLGSSIRSTLATFLLPSPTQLSVIDSLGWDICPGLDLDFVETARSKVAGVFGVQYKQGKPQADTPLRPEFFEAFLSKTADPETDLPSWIREGCPLGIRNSIRPCC